MIEYWDNDYLQTWIDSIATPHGEWYIHDLSLEGTPYYESDLPVNEVLASIPLGFVETGGKSVLIEAKDGKVAIVLEDWLLGCVPNWLYELEELSENPYESEIVISYCEEHAQKLREQNTKLLGEDWKLALDQVYENRATRLAWVSQP